MKRPQILLIGAFFTGISELNAGTLIEKGGLIYYTEQAALCPGIGLVRTQPNRFELRSKPPGFCSLEFPPRQGVFTFALGPLPPGTITIDLQDPLDGSFLSLNFEVHVTNEQTMTAVKRDSAGRISFHINGLESVSYAVQRSSDFTVWTDVATVNGESDFTETEIVDGPVYYRLSVPANQATAIPL